MNDEINEPHIAGARALSIIKKNWYMIVWTIITGMWATSWILEVI